MEDQQRQAVSCQVDGVDFQLLRETDLRWLKSYGTVFRVFDQLFSGNLCFGVEGPYGRLFIKYAGAQTLNFRGKPADAIYQLHQAMPLYAHAHPALTRLLAHGPAGDGYAAVFAWRDALPLGTPDKSGAALEQVRRLPPMHSLAMLDMVFDLHAALCQEEGLIASNFYDGHVLIDLGRNQAVVCDIDLYRQKPAFNNQGRMRGSSLFMAPEEYQLGAVLDETTTLYNMGALAFQFYGDNLNRTLKAWAGPPPLFEVASRATQEAKSSRYPSMRAFLDAWREAVGRCRL